MYNIDKLILDILSALHYIATRGLFIHFLFLFFYFFLKTYMLVIQDVQKKGYGMVWIQRQERH